MTDRDTKIKNWLLEKDLRDKAEKLLEKLDNVRAEHTDSLTEVGLAVLAIDRLLGNDVDNPVIPTLTQVPQLKISIYL